MYDTIEEIVARMNAIKDEMNLDGADIDALTTETNDLVARKAELEKAAVDKVQRDKLSAMLNAGAAIAKPVVAADLDNMVERKAFMDYVLTGNMSEHVRRAVPEGATAVDVSGSNVVADLGVMVPQTVTDEIIKNVEKQYGSIYSRVRKLNIKGGVKFPIGEFGAVFKRISEDSVSGRQKGGSITGSVTFEYHIGEIRLSRTLLQSILTVPAFEAELGKVIAEAYVKGMDMEILNGNPEKEQCEGILTNENVNAIELTEGDLKDWKTIFKKITATLPLGLLNTGYEYVMSASTFISNFLTLANDTNTPIGQFVDGQEARGARINGHDVTLVEPDILPDFDGAADGAVFGMLWLPHEAYAINTNLNFGVVQYVDHEKNQTVTKALVVNDGKVLRPDRIYLLKKKVLEK